MAQPALPATRPYGQLHERAIDSVLVQIDRQDKTIAKLAADIAQMRHALHQSSLVLGRGMQ